MPSVTSRSIPGSLFGVSYVDFPYEVRTSPIGGVYARDDAGVIAEVIEMDDWLVEHIGATAFDRDDNFTYYEEYNILVEVRLRYRFRNINDAIHFKLRWVEG